MQLVKYGHWCLGEGKLLRELNASGARADQLLRALIAIKLALKFCPTSVPGLCSRGSMTVMEAAGVPPFNPGVPVGRLVAPGGPLDCAIADFREALKWDTENPEILEVLRLCRFWRAQLYGQMGEWDRSLELFGECLYREPNSRRIKYEISLVKEARDLDRAQGEEVDDTSSVAATYWSSDTEESDEA